MKACQATGMASSAALRVAGLEIARVTGLERREPEGGDGPTLLWFFVPTNRSVRPGSCYELADDEQTHSIEVLDYDADAGLVIAIERGPAPESADA